MVKRYIELNNKLSIDEIRPEINILAYTVHM